MGGLLHVEADGGGVASREGLVAAVSCLPGHKGQAALGIRVHAGGILATHASPRDLQREQASSVSQTWGNDPAVVLAGWRGQLGAPSCWLMAEGEHQVLIAARQGM